MSYGLFLSFMRAMDCSRQPLLGLAVQEWLPLWLAHVNMTALGLMGSSSSIGYAMPEGIAEANLQPNVLCPWLGEVQRSLDRGPKQPLIDLTPAYPIQGAFVSQENGRMEWTEERLASGDPSFPTSPRDLRSLSVSLLLFYRR